MLVPMTAMPQMVGAVQRVGGGAAALVASRSSGQRRLGGPARPWRRLVFGAVGALRVFWGFMAFGKLQEFMTGRPSPTGRQKR